MKITIGLILSHGFPVPATFVVGYSLLQQTLLTGVLNKGLPERQQIDAVRVEFSHAFPIDAARNELVKRFLEHDVNSDYLLFLDTDMRHPPDLAHRLVAWNRDVVTARYTMRKPPFFTVAMKKTGPLPTDYQAVEKLMARVTGLIPIDAGGAGALLMSRRALLAVRDMLGADDWFRYQDGPDGLRTRSEDMWFYEQVVRAGYQPYLDADCVCGHAAQFEVDPSWHAPYQEALAKAKGQEVTA